MLKGSSEGGFVFFFSSRRRHTRSKRDWSSDVCSSDLEAEMLQRAWRLQHLRLDLEPVAEQDQDQSDDRRSEERRVGKECRYRWAPKQKKKKKSRIKNEIMKKQTTRNKCDVDHQSIATD